MSRGRRYDKEPKLNYKKVFAVIIAIVVFIMFILMMKSFLTKDKETGKTYTKDTEAVTVKTLSYDLPEIKEFKESKKKENSLSVSYEYVDNDNLVEKAYILINGKEKEGLVEIFIRDGATAIKAAASRILPFGAIYLFIWRNEGEKRSREERFWNWSLIVLIYVRWID